MKVRLKDKKESAKSNVDFRLQSEIVNLRLRRMCLWHRKLKLNCSNHSDVQGSTLQKSLDIVDHLPYFYNLPLAGTAFFDFHISAYDVPFADNHLQRHAK